MNKTKPFTRDGKPPDVLAILDELDKMRASHQNDARRHLDAAGRVGEVRDALMAKFRDQLRRSTRRAKGRR